MDAIEFISKVQQKEIDPVENIQKIFEDLKKINKEYDYFNVLDEKFALEQAKRVNKKGKLAGLPISVKDNICVKGLETRATSKLLTSYKPLFDATAIDLLKKEGAIIIGKTSSDAFGFGSFNMNVGIGFSVPKNPFDRERSCGGSSGGSAGITKKANFPHISLAESTGGSIECPASFCGVTGFCPTYGLVSRYGLIDYANSLDKIGPMANSIEEIALVLDVICQYDANDSTSIKSNNNFLKNLHSFNNNNSNKNNINNRNLKINKKNFNILNNNGKKLILKDKNINKKSNNLKINLNNEKNKIPNLKIGIIKESIGAGTDKKIIDLFLKKLNNLDIKYEEISLPLTMNYALETYYILAMSEASTNLAKYCGLRYGKHEPLKGNFNEYFSDVRTKNFNEETKRRVMLGTFARMSGYRDAYYLKAAKIRTLIIEEYKKQFKKFDVLLSPTMPILAPKFSEIKKLSPLQNYMMDILTVGPNLAGIPHLSMNMGNIDGLPAGMMAMGDHFEEKNVLNFGMVVQNALE